MPTAIIGVGNIGKRVAADLTDAIDQADAVIFAVWFDPMKELIGMYASHLAGKVVIDPSNPIGPDGKGSSPWRRPRCCCNPPPTRHLTEFADRPQHLRRHGGWPVADGERAENISAST